MSPRILFLDIETSHLRNWVEEQLGVDPNK